ncbi:MAG: acyl-CoA/acyl-ACP dehydrogenase [Spirochaetes bacterium]|nr:acyl-CoA/acyl-ACP dehydrogenase [Spirochaetota bacterium]
MNMKSSANSISEELQAFSDLARDFAARELVQQREENDRYPFGELFTQSIKNAGVVGFFGANLPAEYGGVGMVASALAPVLENLSMADASMACIVFTNAAAIEIINQAARETDCAKIYRFIGGPDAKPVAFHSFTCLEEIDMPRADAKGIISGRLNFIALAEFARYAVIPAENPDGAISYYLVDLNDGGVAKTGPVYSLGLHACPAADLSFNKVPGTLIGNPGHGEIYFKAMQSHLSIGAAAISLGIMKGSFIEAFEYTKERFQGGRQIINWSEVRMLLANMAIEAQVGESCLASACRGNESGDNGWEYSARAAAIHIGELACRATVDGVQLLGGNGYMKDYGQEKRMRDAKQVQCLLGMAPVRKIDYIGRIIDESE